MRICVTCALLAAAVMSAASAAAVLAGSGVAGDSVQIWSAGLVVTLGVTATGHALRSGAL